MRTLVAALAIACLSACGFVGFPGVYRIDVEQGNIVDEEMVNQLKPGMSRRQVRFILGTPLIEDTFNENRWDYIYVKRNGLDVLSESRLTVVFEGDELTEVSGDFQPPAWSTGEPGAVEPGTPPAAEDAENEAS
jgi:outer membrane protein assembly factor BamE